MKRFLPILLLTLSVGCSSLTPTKALLVSEASLSASASAFVAFDTEAARRCNAKPRTASDAFCDAARTVNVTFKEAFPYSIALWKIARKANDPKLQAATEQGITGLLDDAEPLAKQIGMTLKPKEK